MNHNELSKLALLQAIPTQPVVPSKQFKKDFKRLAKSGYDLGRLKLAIELIRHKCKLPRGYDAHRLVYVNNRIDIHILSDWVLIYKQLHDSKGDYIKLYRTGPHNWIFK